MCTQNEMHTQCRTRNVVNISPKIATCYIVLWYNFRHCSLCIVRCLIAHYFIFSRSLILFSSLNAYNLSSPWVNGEYICLVWFFSLFFFFASSSFDRLIFIFDRKLVSLLLLLFFIYFCFVCILSFDNQIFASFEAQLFIFFVWIMLTPQAYARIDA